MQSSPELPRSNTLTSITLAHVNICSLRHKIHDITKILHTPGPHKIHILAITETWLDSSIADTLVAIQNFTLYRRDRGTGRGGGICFYVHDSLHVTSTITAADIEVMYIRIAPPHKTSEGLVVGCVYRPPSSTVSFWGQLEESIDQIAHSCKTQPLLLGDLNVNVLNPSQNPNYHHLKQLCDTVSLRNVITDPTRLPSNSCLDLALIPKLLPADVTLAGTGTQPMDGVTDHCLIFVSLHVSGPVYHRQLIWHKSVRKPAVREVDPGTFGPDLVQALNSKDTADLSLDSLTEIWTTTVHEMLDKYCPLHTVSLTTHPPPPPWSTPELTQLLRRRKHLHRKWKKHRDEHSRQEFRAVRRAGTLLSRRLRTSYYTKQFIAHQRNPRAHWQVLNRLLGRHKLLQPLPVTTGSLTSVFSQQVHDPTRPKVIDLPHGPLQEMNFDCFKPISVTQVERLLMKVNPWKAMGSDEIPPVLLKRNVEHLAGTLHVIFNESLQTGIFPDHYRLAHICPVYKKGPRGDATNYRPISLLPTVSKVLERIVYEQLQEYIRSRPDILPAQQFAYRSHHSCEDALALCINSWQRSIDEGKVVALALLDLSKAFDCVNHIQLLTELFQCGIGGTALAWFESYLSGRRQCVKAPQSPLGTLYTCGRGVPQGSVLGPLLFTIYTRQLPTVLSRCHCLLYADDTSLYISEKDQETAISNLEGDIGRVSKFLSEKRLCLNPAKTQFLVLRKPGVPPPARPLVINGSLVAGCQQAKYLGLVIDEHLTFKAQVDNVRKRVGSKLGALFRCRRLLTAYAKRAFYLSFIQSTIEYACTSYVHCLHSTEYDALVRISKRALRIVFGYPYAAHTAPLLSKYKLLPITARFNLKLYVFVHRCIRGRANPLLQSIFCSRDACTSRTASQTRSQTSLGLVLPHVSTRYGLLSLSFLAADRWNALPSHIRMTAAVMQFRNSVSTWLGYPVRRP